MEILWVVLLAGLGAFLFFIFYGNEKKPVNLWEHRLEGKITSRSLHRGFIKLEKEIWISQNLPEISGLSGKKTGRLIGAIPPPYYMKKAACDSVFLLLKNNDTLYFNLLRYDSINDPTFSQLYRRIFKN